jgi:tRNA(Ile)-lysidine synthase
VLSRVLRTIRDHRLLDRGERVLVAVSGGPDSLALLHVLVQLADRLGVQLEVATVNHQLRAAAATEAEEVARRCARLSLPCTILAVDVAAERGAHVSLQDAARRARLGALQALASLHGCDRVALGHTADDQAETILFRIIRGTGVSGLRGIPYQRGVLVRPLLDVRRAEVLRFLERRQISYATDPANSDRRFSRSRVRHDWLPYLARENPRVVEALLALGQSARPGPTTAALPAGLPPLGPRAAERLRALLATGGGTKLLSVPGGVIEVAYGEARFRPAAAGRDNPAALPARNVAAEDLPIAGVGRYHWPPGAPPATAAAEIDIVLETRASKPAGPVRGAATFASEALAGEGWVVRAPRPGDRMHPRGGPGRRKLQDLLVDAKVPRVARACLPVVTTREGTILFVPGLRPSESARPAPEAQAWLEIRVKLGGWSTFRATIDSPAPVRVDDE